MSGNNAAPKLLGVIGGMGPQATCLFYSEMIRRTDAACDQAHIPMILLSHSTMPDRTKAILSGQEETVFSLLLQDAKLLEEKGARAIAIPCNTSHYFADRLQEALSIPILNMVRETAKTMAAKGRKKVGILATDGTVQTGLYQKECIALGLTPMVPGEELQKIVMHIIYEEIKRGLPGSRDLFDKIDTELQSQGCDGAILACTELSCFGAMHNLSDYYTDAMGILVNTSIVTCGGRLRA